MKYFLAPGMELSSVFTDTKRSMQSLLWGVDPLMEEGGGGGHAKAGGGCDLTDATPQV